MSQDFSDNNQDVDSPAQQAHRQSFIERMQLKLEAKESAFSARD